MTGELIHTSGDFILNNFAENFIQAYLKGTAPYIVLTGGADTKQLIVPFPHRLVKLIARQTDAANAAAITPLDVKLTREVGQINELLLMNEDLQTQGDLTDERNTLLFGEGFEYETTAYTITVTGTATNRVHLLVYLQRLGGRH